jgi:hypothetical protein
MIPDYGVCMAFNVVYKATWTEIYVRQLFVSFALDIDKTFARRVAFRNESQVFSLFLKYKAHCPFFQFQKEPIIVSFIPQYYIKYIRTTIRVLSTKHIKQENSQKSGLIGTCWWSIHIPEKKTCRFRMLEDPSVWLLSQLFSWKIVMEFLSISVNDIHSS